MTKKTPIRMLSGLLVASALVLLPGTVAEAEDDLPPCAATDLVAGIATLWYPDGDFKISVTPTERGRWVATWHLYSIWHVVQACVPGLYDETADRVYAQLACHADLSAVGNPLNGGEYVTGPTWDLESRKDTASELHSLATLCSSERLGYGSDHDEGSWDVYFGTPPVAEAATTTEPEPVEEPTPSYSGIPVSVDFTGGVGLWTRTGPGYGADRIEVLPDGTGLTMLCQTHSETISDWITSDLWDYVRLGDGQEVWVSDVFVMTGSNGQVAPDC